jgi:hypothetical protein
MRSLATDLVASDDGEVDDDAREKMASSGA